MTHSLPVTQKAVMVSADKRETLERFRDLYHQRMSAELIRVGVVASTIRITEPEWREAVYEDGLLIRRTGWFVYGYGDAIGEVL